MIPLSRPDIDDADRRAVEAVLRTPSLSLGPAGPAFETALSNYVGTRHAVAVNSGTSGLHLAVIALGLAPGDEVITTPFSFVASANCLLFEKVRPVFVDIDPATLNIDPAAVEAAVTPRTRAILPVHVFGRPCDMAALCAIAERHDLAIIEDACEALGTTVGGRHAGSSGRVGVFAFYPNKQMTTGEGGMIVTDDDALARLCRSLRNQGRATDDGWLQHPRLGFNYRLSDIASALGLSQLGRIETFITARQRVFDLYAEALGDVAGLRLPAGPGHDERISWFVYVVRLDETFRREDRDAVLGALREDGIGCRDYFQPIHLQPYMSDQFSLTAGDFPVTESVADRTLALPFHNRLTAGEVAAVATSLRRALGRLA
ncbi:MAG: DegT/DnrJ/EryC1/StrS family aminotransferase [Acidobacteriota bacterium]